MHRQPQEYVAPASAGPTAFVVRRLVDSKSALTRDAGRLNPKLDASERHWLGFGTWILVGIWVWGFGFCSSGRAADKITYQDHILPLVEANCSKCHNADKKKADLDLTSYQGALKGSGSGPVVLSGNVDGSKLWKAVTHAEEPNMPPNRPKLADKDLELIKKWISGG